MGSKACYYITLFRKYELGYGRDMLLAPHIDIPGIPEGPKVNSARVPNPGVHDAFPGIHILLGKSGSVTAFIKNFKKFTEQLLFSKHSSRIGDMAMNRTVNVR